MAGAAGVVMSGDKCVGRHMCSQQFDDRMLQRTLNSTERQSKLADLAANQSVTATLRIATTTFSLP